MSVRRYVTLLENFSQLKKIINIPAIISLSIIILLFSNTVILADSSPLIKNIEIKGNRKISDDTIFSKIKSGVRIKGREY